MSGWTPWRYGPLVDEQPVEGPQVVELRAEVGRLQGQVAAARADADRERDRCAAAWARVQELSTVDDARRAAGYWQRMWETDRRNLTAAHDRIAALEGRPVSGGGA